MKFRQLTKTEFKAFSNKHPQCNFYQTEAWSNLKVISGWTYEYLGLVDGKKKVVAATIILSKKIKPLNGFIYYAQRGFLIDYCDKKLLKTFTSELLRYLKNKSAIFIKIDPYVEYNRFDKNGDNPLFNPNDEVVNNLKEVGYKHNGFSKGFGKNIQPRYNFIINLEKQKYEDILKTASNSNKRNLKEAKKNDLKITKVKIDRVEELHNILKDTSDRKLFSERPLSYFEKMYKEFNKDIEFVFVTVNKDNYIKQLQKELDKLNNSFEKLNVDTDNQKINEVSQKILKIIEKIDRFKDNTRQMENDILISAGVFITHGSEMYYAYGGSYEQFLSLKGPVVLQDFMIQEAIKKKYKIYNFGGISGDFTNIDDPDYGVYDFKRRFGGNVSELIGEFDYIINRPKYLLFKLSLKVYKSLKKLRNRI